MLTEEKLIEKLKLVEALYAGHTTTGEKEAAQQAADRIRARLREMTDVEPVIEYKFSLNNLWSRRLLTALMRRYDIKPFRYYRQRHTTVMAKVPASFVNQVLWPEFQKLNEILTGYLNDITRKIITESIFDDSSEAEVMKELPPGGLEEEEYEPL